MLPTREEIERAAMLVHDVLPRTPEIRWPLLCERSGAEVWVKHENHLPTGAFKVRGALVYAQDLRSWPSVPGGVIAATRGNHGQAAAFGANRMQLPVTIVVPHGNSTEKNAAMRALGAELIEHGRDFDEALEHTRRLAEERRLHLWPNFHPLLIRGVATWAWEMLHAVPDLATLYVPVGLGSAICGAIAARDALGLRTQIVGVVAEQAPTYALSFADGRAQPTTSADTIADGLAVRIPDPDALDVIRRGAERIVALSEDEIADAMRAYFTDTHNVAEGAGAAALGALLFERERMAGRRVGVVLTGGNVDRTLYASVLDAASRAIPLPGPE